MKTQNIIIVKPQGYCGGVLKAIETAKKTRIQYPNQKITILGNLVHNQYVKKHFNIIPLIPLKIRQRHAWSY